MRELAPSCDYRNLRRLAALFSRSGLCAVRSPAVEINLPRAIHGGHSRRVEREGFARGRAILLVLC